MDKAVIVGAGTYGQVYASYIKDTGAYNLIGFLDDDTEKIGRIYNGLPVLGSLTLLSKNNFSEFDTVFIPLGSNNLRRKFLETARMQGFTTPCYIHPQSIIHHSVMIGESVYILPATSIMPHTVIEDNVMISMGVNVAHHTILRSGSFLSQGVNVGASIEIGVNSFIGIGATIMTGISRVGDNTIIGAGSVVIRDVPDNAVVAGNPAKILRFQPSK